MKTNLSYWACQGIGWGLYVAIGLTMATQQMGWKASIVAGYLLFFFYSIALTDLLRREMKRRHWLDASTGRLAARLGPAVLAIGTVQTLLVAGISFGLTGSAVEYANPASMRSAWISIT